MTKEKKQEFTYRITRANKSQMIVILYDMVLQYLQDAMEAFEQKDRKDYKSSISGAKNCLDELLASLNYTYEVSHQLRNLYYFYKRELSTASIMEKKELIPPIMDMIKELKKSYEAVAEKDTSAPIMENTQSVYAGLTYSKDSLNINLSDQGSDRGFRV